MAPGEEKRLVAFHQASGTLEAVSGSRSPADSRLRDGLHRLWQGRKFD